jgi:hypothetical protein
LPAGKACKTAGKVILVLSALPFTDGRFSLEEANLANPGQHFETELFFDAPAYRCAMDLWERRVVPPRTGTRAYAPGTSLIKINSEDVGDWYDPEGIRESSRSPWERAR